MAKASTTLAAFTLNSAVATADTAGAEAAGHGPTDSNIIFKIKIINQYLFKHI